MFDIKITSSGFDISAEKLKEIMENITFDGISKHCNNIKEEAKKCGITEKDLELYAIQEKNDKIIIHEELKDKTKFQCLKMAFEKIISSLPDGVRAIFQDILNRMEKKYTS